MILQSLSSGASQRPSEYPVWTDTPLKSARMEVSPAVLRTRCSVYWHVFRRGQIVVLIHHDKNAGCPFELFLRALISVSNFRSLYEQLVLDLCLKHFDIKKHCGKC